MPRRSWTDCNRDGREAMAIRRYEAAERSFLACLELLEGEPTHDVGVHVGVHVTLGSLVLLASVVERLGHGEDASRVMAIVSEHSAGEAAQCEEVISYESRYRDMIQEPLPHLYRPPRPVKISRRSQIDELIKQTADRYQVDHALVRAVVAVESNFEPRAVSSAGAMGLMQLMPATAREMGVRAPFRPRDNLAGGVRYLRSMLDRYQDVAHALAAYNAGPHVVDRYGTIPPYPETEAYVKRVLSYYRNFKAQFAN